MLRPILLLALAIPAIASAQPGPDHYFPPSPVLPGGADSLHARVVYPPDALADGVEGLVVVEFTVDADGRTSEPYVHRSPDPRLSAEAVRVIESLRFEWSRPPREGEVPVRWAVPVWFRLPS